MKFGMFLFMFLCLALPAQAQEEATEDTLGIVAGEGVDVSVKGDTLIISAEATDEADIVHPVTLEDLRAYIASCTAETKEVVGYYLNGDPIYETKQTKTEPTFIGFIEWLEKKESR